MMVEPPKPFADGLSSEPGRIHAFAAVEPRIVRVL